MHSIQNLQTKPTKPNLPNQTHLTKPTKPKFLVKAVNAWVRSAFGNVLIAITSIVVTIIVLLSFNSIKNGEQEPFKYFRQNSPRRAPIDVLKTIGKLFQ